MSDVVAAGSRRPSQAGRSLFDYADDLAVDVPASCQRTGRCRECVVEVRAGEPALSAPSPAEAFLLHPYRLACQARIERDDVEIEFASVRRPLRILTSSVEDEAVEVDPLVTVRDGVVHYGDEPIEPVRERVLGLAVDLGTTTIVFELVDLVDGSPIALGALENPQRFGGSDVVTRIHYESLHPGVLRQALRRALNRELRRAYTEAGVDRHDVYEAFVVGNTTMRDLFLGLDVAPIGRSPFRSTTEQAVLDGAAGGTSVVRLAHEIGLLVHPRARVVGGPLIASHVGADAAADLVAAGALGPAGAPGAAGALGPAAGALGETGAFLLVDVGTNTEVIAGAGGRLVAASSPAGPAFEGGGYVTHGMPAAEGAIEAIEISNGAFSWRTIGDAPAVGICGSGLVDLLAELLRVGRLTSRGRVDGDGDQVEVVPAAGVRLSRRDVSHLAQAKSANVVGQQVLLRALGIGPADLEHVYLAGGFANHLDVGKAIEIGLVLPVAPDRVRRIGNASLRGARMLLLSVRLRNALEDAVRRIEHIRLEAERDFFELYVDGLAFARARELTTPGAT